MKTIHKFRLVNVAMIQWIDMPIHARAISAQMQYGALCVWAEVDAYNRPIPHEFLVAETGSPMPGHGNWRHIDTVQDGGLVFHVYFREPE